MNRTLPESNTVKRVLNIRQYLGPRINEEPFLFDCPYAPDPDNTGDGPWTFVLAFTYDGEGEIDGEKCHQYKYEEMRVYAKERAL